MKTQNCNINDVIIQTVIVSFTYLNKQAAVRIKIVPLFIQLVQS